MTAPTPHSPTAARAFTQRLSATPRGARLARLLAVEQLRAWPLPPDLVERAEHITAELAANAALHGQTTGDDFQITLTLGPVPGHLRIEVTDTRPESLPAVTELPSPEAESGRGLLLVTALADRWGTTAIPPTRKTTWA
ncbi:MAG: ATP-binding protein, partial [Streptomycetaceae bacterium]|nr:ATP-binding protein [Streptomycetaceae bacterium]